jgi:hypothetical protein
MGTPALLRLKHKDFGALIVFCLIGFMVGQFIPDPTWSAYLAMLVSYHFFLGWLVFMGEEKARRSLPIVATISVHLTFIALVVVVVGGRRYIPYFNLFPVPAAAIGLWILSGAIPLEEDEENPAAPRRARAADTSRQRQAAPTSARSVAAETPQTAAASRAPKAEPAVSVAHAAAPASPPPVQPVTAPPPPEPAMSSEAQPEWANKVMQTLVGANARPATAEAGVAQPQPLASAPLPVMPDGEPMPEWAIKVMQTIAAANAMREEPARSSTVPQPAVTAAESRADDRATQPEAPLVIAAVPANSTEAPRKPAAVPQESAVAIYEVQPRPAKNGFRPLVSGLAIDAKAPAGQPETAPNLFRDNSIAEDLRQRHPDELTRLKPILAATAEDHEEWLRVRGLENPTHRKPGLTVQEEYEQWLMTRVAARTAQSQREATEAVSAPQDIVPVPAPAPSPAEAKPVRRPGRRPRRRASPIVRPGADGPVRGGIGHPVT